REPPLVFQLSPADLITLTNISLGSIALLYIIDGGITDLYIASLLFLVCLVLDGADGAAARRWGSSRMGAALDSLGDEIVFVAFPLLLLYTLDYRRGISSLQDPGNALVVFSIGLYAAAGSVRLTVQGMGPAGAVERRDAGREKGMPDSVRGMPVSIPSLLVVLSFLWEAGGWDPIPFFRPLVLLACSIPLLSGWRYPRLRGPGAILALAVVALGGLHVACRILPPCGLLPAADPAFLAPLLLGAVAYLLSPAYLRVRRRRADVAGREKVG
ncbi:MAG: CDP-alcohol phosphatidyltransferase family protein, partial [Thermoplasmata archaeon]|nr:CDP-alcohol phosphatidyltransferase family protein [Thermoplasmata archaeon]